MVMAERIRPPGPFSLLARTNLTLTVSSLLIALISTIALNYFVIEPIAERSAADEAALLVLSAQTWVELPPEARPYFELELAQNHDLIVNSVPRTLPTASADQPYLSLLEEQLSRRLNAPVELLSADDLTWVEIPMGGFELQIGFSPERRDIQPLYGGIIIVVLGAGIVFLTSLSIVQRIARPLVQAAELGRYGITSNAIAPSARTRMTEEVFAEMMKAPESGFDAMAPENVAPLVVWLGSAQSRDVTGRVFEVAGGEISLADGWREGPKVDRGARWEPDEVGAAVHDLLAKAVPPQKVYGT